MKNKWRIFLCVICVLLLSGCTGVQSPMPTDGICKISISCRAILDNMSKLKSEKKDFVPVDGWILKETEVGIKNGESVFDVLQRTCRDKRIQMESSFTPGFNSAYIEGIGQLYEFDCGPTSGWTYKVNGEEKPVGCSQVIVSNNDKIELEYTCSIGRIAGKEEK